MMRQRHPELPHVQARLFGAEPAATGQPASVAAWADAAPALPAFLADLVRQRTAARQAQASGPRQAQAGGSPQAGRIAALDVPHPGLAGRLALLLDQPQGADAWRGWLVSPDPEYAGPGDLPLDDGQAPIDPSAALAQTWNPVTVRSAWLREPLGQAGDDTLAACRGTRNADIPRIADPGLAAYRALYAQAADHLRAAFAAAPEATPPLAALIDRLRAWAQAAGHALVPVHWVPEPMHGHCPHDALALDGRLELQPFDAGNGLVGLRLRALGTGTLTVRLTQPGGLTVQQALEAGAGEAEWLLEPTSPASIEAWDGAGWCFDSRYYT